MKKIYHRSSGFFEARSILIRMISVALALVHGLMVHETLTLHAAGSGRLSEAVAIWITTVSLSSIVLIASLFVGKILLSRLDRY